MKPLRNFLLAVTLLVGVMIGVVAAGSLEPFLEPILVFFAEESAPKLRLVPVDFNPFPDERDI